MWKGKLEMATPMLFAVGFLFNFLIGGITGVMVASPPIDYHAEDSYFIVAHFHYTLGGGSMFAVFAAIYFWFPKMFGVKLNELMGKVNFWTMFIGFNLTFLPQFFLGIEGMPRRVYTYPAIADLPWLNELSTIGAAIIGVSVVIFILNVFVSKVAQEPVSDDPWDGGQTLEWATTSPPPEFNFHALPPIRSERPAWDLRHPELAEER
jgi:cytochrome c oxidase subunit 1